MKNYKIVFYDNDKITKQLTGFTCYATVMKIYWKEYFSYCSETLLDINYGLPKNIDIKVFNLATNSEEITNLADAS